MRFYGPSHQARKRTLCQEAETPGGGKHFTVKVFRIINTPTSPIKRQPGLSGRQQGKRKT